MQTILVAKNGWRNLYESGFYRGTIKPGRYQPGFRLKLPGNRVIEGFSTIEGAAKYAFAHWLNGELIHPTGLFVARD